VKLITLVYTHDLAVIIHRQLAATIAIYFSTTSTWTLCDVHYPEPHKIKME